MASHTGCSMRKRSHSTQGAGRGWPPASPSQPAASVAIAHGERRRPRRIGDRAAHRGYLCPGHSCQSPEAHAVYSPGLYVGITIALVGFALFAAIHHFDLWWTRRERSSLIFVACCVPAAIVCAAHAAAATVT